MDARDQFFKNIFDANGADAETTKFQRQLSFEDRCVRRIFRECGVSPAMGALKNACRAYSGHDDFSFQWFNDQFCQFPARLCGKRVSYVGKRNDKPLYLHQLTIADLFQPNNNLLLRVVSRITQEFGVNTERPFICMFPIVRRMFCAHNLDLENRVSGAKEESRLQWSLFRGNVRLFVESSQSLFSTIGSEWHQF